MRPRDASPRAGARRTLVSRSFGVFPSRLDLLARLVGGGLRCEHEPSVDRRGGIGDSRRQRTRGRLLLRPFARAHRSTVCINGHLRIGNDVIVSGKAHAWVHRAHKRTFQRRKRHFRVRKSTRAGALRVKTDTSASETASSCPEKHTLKLRLSPRPRRHRRGHLWQVGRLHQSVYLGFEI